MTPWTPTRVAALLADALAQAPQHYQRGISLLQGWLPFTIQIVAAVLLVVAIDGRSRRWRRIGVPVSLAIGAAVAARAYWYITSEGLADDPAPSAVWVWIGLSGTALAVLVLGFRSARWWRRGVSVLAIAACLLSTSVALNTWVGYFRTVQSAWGQLTAGPLPDETDMASVQALAVSGVVPPHGEVVPVDIPDTASGFHHRTELVYLPPAWFTSSPPPKLPVVMMITGEFNTPEDWLRTGNVAQTADNFAADHGGNTPVLVFVDSGGSFNNDTECVNGSRGNSADHLTGDVVPFVTSTFGTSSDPANWGIVGWSMGGTCAVDLTVMHPELFRTFVDIAGDLGPIVGTKDQTIQRLFGGNADQWADFDPTTVIDRHGLYTGVSGWFAVSTTPANQQHGGFRPNNNQNQQNADATGLGGRDAGGNPDDQSEAASSLCGLGRTEGIDCAIVASPGKHDWPFAADTFTDSLPWLAGAIGTPDVPRIPLPPDSSSPDTTTDASQAAGADGS